MRLIRLLYILIICLVCVRSVTADTFIYFPIILKGSDSMLNSTLRIVIPRYGKNHVLNPSGEGSGNYSAINTAIISINSNNIQKYGIHSYSIQMLASGDGLQLTLLALENYPHYFTARLRLQSQPVTVTFGLGSTSKTALLLEKLDDEWGLYGATFSDVQANGQTTAKIILSAAAGLQPGISADGIQVEPIINEPSLSVDTKPYSTYIDGSQPGCRFIGAPNASASIRSADSRAGGIVTEFWAKFKFFPEKAIGMGTAIEELNVDEYAFLPGGELNSSKIPSREFSIVGYFYASTLPELHANAQALERELGLNTYPGSQPVRLRYLGAAVQKEISANYINGLEGELPIYYTDTEDIAKVYDISQEDDKWAKTLKYKMRASINFKALDPFWYEVGESSTLLDTNDTITSELIAARLQETGQWSNLNASDPAAGASEVFAIAEDTTYVYIGGSFVNWNGNASSDRIVRYNKQTGVYSPMGTGAAGDVRAIIIGPDGKVYIAGTFTSVGGVADTAKVAVWDPVTETWAALATGLSGTIYSLAFSPAGVLYAGGSTSGHAFDVAYWDGAAWNSVAVTDGIVYALAFDNTGLLYAGGSYSIIDGVSSDSLSTFDGSDWVDIGVSISNSVRAIAVNPVNNLVYVGGIYTAIGGVSANNIAVYNRTIFSPLGDGVGVGGSAASAVYSITIGSDGLVFIGGAFNTAGDISSPGLTVWNGYTFARLDIEFPNPVTKEVYSIFISKYDVDPVINKRYSFYVGSNVLSSAGDTAIAGLETVDNEGTIPAFPKIVFSRSGGTSATIISLRNERTGRRLLFEYALLDGESLTIDLNPKNRKIISSFFGERMDATLPSSDLSVWQLLPGDNDVTAYVSEGGSPTVTGYILYRTPYKSWN